MFTVATLNLLNDLSRWSLRGPLVVQQLRALSPDLIALQEVALPANNAQWIADRLDGYSVHVTRKTGRSSQHEALAVLSRLPVHEHAALSLIYQNRVAQYVVVEREGALLTFANAHLYVGVRNDVPRIEQVRRILAWLPRQNPLVLCGDFNAMPDSATVHMMRQEFASAYAAVHGCEPDYTYPTPLETGSRLMGVASRLVMRVGGWLQNRADVPFRATVDYVFVGPSVHVHDCHIAFDNPLSGRPRIYPSDHLGLVATLEHGRIDATNRAVE